MKASPDRETVGFRTHTIQTVDMKRNSCHVNDARWFIVFRFVGRSALLETSLYAKAMRSPNGVDAPAPLSITRPEMEIETSTFMSTSVPLEWRRKAVHLLPGFVPFVMWFVYHEDPLPLWNVGVAAAVIAGLTLVVVTTQRSARRNRNENWLIRCITYAVTPVVALLLFPANAEYASTVVCVLAFGDTGAAIFGKLLGKRPLPWNPQKTWIGLMAFVLCATVMGTLAFWGESNPKVSLSAAAMCGAAAAVAAGVMETIRSRIDDNLRISIAALVCVVVVSKMILVLPSSSEVGL